MQTAPSQWLAATVKKGMEIGLDPRLHSETAVKAYRDRLAAKGARLVLLDENPLMPIGTTGLNCRTRRWSFSRRALPVAHRSKSAKRWPPR